jgi:deazaflavin-dependent oxidoreductase (nitroreductase family)
MPRTRLFVAALGAVGALVATGVAMWRRNPRLGSGVVNAIVNPRLMRSGFAGSGASELAALEHIGRRSGLRRVTPVHPEPMPGGFRILVPLGPRSEWARNVLAAGHCRLQLHDTVYELDEPRLVTASEAGHLPAPARRLASALGFDYLLLRQFAAVPGTLTDASGDAAIRSHPGSPATLTVSSPVEAVPAAS